MEGAITTEAYAEYLRCWEAEGAVEASCADYRAVERDLEHDAEDRAAGCLIECPVLTLWATEMAKRKGWQTGQSLDHMTVWRERASDVRGCKTHNDWRLLLASGLHSLKSASNDRANRGY